jgi:plastocyanin
MFFFVLGTSPLFALVGVATAKLSEAFRQNFLKLAAALLIFLGLSGLNGVLNVLDAPITFEKITQPIVYYFSDEWIQPTGTAQTPTQAGVQKVLINVMSSGYSPRKIQVKAGAPVELTLQTKDTYSCASSFVLKAFNIKLQLGPNDSKTVSFTPTQKGKYPFTCSMGMYTGVFEVI